MRSPTRSAYPTKLPADVLSAFDNAAHAPFPELCGVSPLRKGDGQHRNRLARAGENRRRDRRNTDIDLAAGRRIAALAYPLDLLQNNVRLDDGLGCELFKRSTE